MSGAAASPFARALGDAGALLPETHQKGFRRLAKLIAARLGRFQLLFPDCRDERLRDRLIAELDVFVAASGARAVRLDLDPALHRDFAALEAALTRLAATHQVIHVRGGPAWFDADRWAAFNIRREAVSREARAALLFWLDAEAIAELATVAVDLWNWRAAVVTFVSAPGPSSPPTPDFREVDDRSASERERRVEVLRDALLATDLPDDLKATLYAELGDLYLHLGRPEAAERAYREALHATTDEGTRAALMNRIANVLQRRGDLEAALRIRREEVAPVFARLGHVHSYAVTMGEIADVLHQRGDLDEALRIRREEELPVYERLGDLRSRAITMGRIADILVARGDLEEALRLRREEVLPVFARLGEVRGYAATMGRIADVLAQRGELEEALRVWRDEVAPVFKRLGDVRAYALTVSKIADALFALEDLEQAVHVWRDLSLPLFDRLGDARERSVTLFRIADATFAGRPDRANAGHDALTPASEAFEIADRLGLPDGVAHAGLLLARILAAAGRAEEAEAPLEAARAAFSKLGDSSGMRQADEMRRSLARRG